MSLCRGTQEMEAILGQGSEGQEPLARLRLAVQSGEKMVGYMAELLIYQAFKCISI